MRFLFAILSRAFAIVPEGAVWCQGCLLALSGGLVMMLQGRKLIPQEKPISGVEYLSNITQTIETEMTNHELLHRACSLFRRRWKILPCRFTSAGEKTDRTTECVADGGRERASEGIQSGVSSQSDVQPPAPLSIGKRLYKAAENPRHLPSSTAVGSSQVRSPMLMACALHAADGVSPSTAGNYLTAARSFVRFNSGRDLPLSAISDTMVRRYERWLRLQGIAANTSSCYLRSLRALWQKSNPGAPFPPSRHGKTTNACGRRRSASAPHAGMSPFAGVFTGNEPTPKRSIGRADIRRLQLLDLSACASLAFARDLFLFSLYAMGMPLADMAALRRSNIRNGMITYRRRKTGRVIRLHIEPCMLQLIEHYARADTDRLFPILHKAESETDAHRQYASFLRSYNRRLKRIARMAGITAPLTSYTSRHTWASLAYAGNIHLPVISKALGHAHTQTTLVYIREIDDRRVEQANKKILKTIKCPPLTKRWTPVKKTLQKYSISFT